MGKRLLLTLFLAVLLASVIVFNSCGNNTPTTTTTTPTSRWAWGVVDKTKPATVIDTSTGKPIRDVSVEEAYAIINTTIFFNNLKIIDVRSPEEFATGHIENAKNIDVNAGDILAQLGELNKNMTYIVYCNTGIRSDIARDILEELGFSFVINMTGGINAWVAAGLPVVK
jgi:rhodanese-related sulfurtransferase